MIAIVIARIKVLLLVKVNPIGPYDGSIGQVRFTSTRRNCSKDSDMKQVNSKSSSISTLQIDYSIVSVRLQLESTPPIICKRGPRDRRPQCLPFNPGSPFIEAVPPELNQQHYRTGSNGSVLFQCRSKARDVASPHQNTGVNPNLKPHGNREETLSFRVCENQQVLDGESSFNLLVLRSQFSSI